MGKWFGKIGFATEIETAPDVHEEKIIERDYYGDMLTDFRRNEARGEVLDGITLNNEFSVLGDPYTQDSIDQMRYITYRGTKWKISSVEVNYPRLHIKVGGIYRGEDAGELEQDIQGDTW